MFVRVLNIISLALLTFCLASNSSVQAAAKKGKKITNHSEKTLSVDISSSNVSWIGNKVTGSHNGNLKIKQGELKVKEGKLLSGKVEIDMNSLTNIDLTDASLNQKIVGHLKSPDFFSVEKFPTAIFIVKEVKELAKAKPGAPTHQISGDLTIKGITNAESFPVMISIKDDVLEAKASAEIDRTKYDVKYGSGKFFQNLGDKMISDKFKVLWNINAKL